MFTFIEILSDAAIRSAALLALIAVAIPLVLQRTSAARRHLLWSIALLACIAIPLFSLLLPHWEVLPAKALPSPSLLVQQPSAPQPAADISVSANVPAASYPNKEIAPAVAQSIPAPSSRPVDWQTVIALTYALGFIVMVLPIIVGRLLLVRLVRSSRLFSHVRQTATPVLTSPRCSMPMAFGILRPRIMLPDAAEFWPAERLDAVIAHEEAHIRRFDCLWQTLAQIARAIYWFNPLAWYACRRLFIESERACDDAVLQNGAPSASYADHLLSIATAGRSDAFLAAAAIAMARPTTLEGRLLSILDAARNRQRVTLNIAAAAVILIAAIAIPLATLHAQTPRADTTQTAQAPAAVVVPADAAKTIKNAVETISTCAETDPRVKEAMATLKGIPSRTIAAGLVPYLQSNTDTIRRAALYVLFRGELDDVSPAVPALLPLCLHKEDFTRGMAALAIGQCRISEGYKPLIDMVNDASPFTRRCAAYALGLMGNRDALPVLRKLAAEDDDKNVRDNAQAAITMLSNPATTNPAAGDIKLDLVTRIPDIAWPVHAIAPGSSPAFTWQLPQDARGTIGYMGFIVAPIARSDVKNIQPSEMWETMNKPERMTWFVMGMPGTTTRIRYASAPEAQQTLTTRAAKPLAEGFYMVMVSGYAGQYNPAEGRQGAIAGGCVLRVGNPKEPAKLDTSKLTPAIMKARLQQFVESFFKSNYRDITARKTLEWGDAVKETDGNWSVRYKYEATIWNKDKIIQDKLFTFTPEGGFVRVKDTTATATVPATTPPDASAALPPLRQRNVDKIVPQFPEAKDLSTPETAWAAWQRANSKMDAQSVVDLSWVKLTVDEEKKFWEQGLASNPEGTRIYTQALATSRLIEVWIDRDELATTICYLSFPQGKGREPYSLRVFGRIAGQWKNLGEDRYATLEEAREAPRIKRAGFWNQFQDIKGQQQQPAAGRSNVPAPAGVPAVVKSTPGNMEQNVDPALAELQVVFDQPMDTGGFSWVGGGPAYPQTTGQAHWIDDRTCVLPVKLEAGRDYWFSINNFNFTNFRSKAGVPVRPYPVWFQTTASGSRKASGPPKVAKTEPAAGAVDVHPRLKEIRVTFDQPMDPTGFSWVTVDENFPRTSGKAHWIDDRTCALPVTLEPGHEYSLSLNASGFTGFCGKSGVPLLPQPLSFQTSGEAK